MQENLIQKIGALIFLINEIHHIPENRFNFLMVSTFQTTELCLWNRVFLLVKRM